MSSSSRVGHSDEATSHLVALLGSSSARSGSPRLASSPSGDDTAESQTATQGETKRAIKAGARERASKGAERAKQSTSRAPGGARLIKEGGGVLAFRPAAGSKQRARETARDGDAVCLSFPGRRSRPPLLLHHHHRFPPPLLPLHPSLRVSPLSISSLFLVALSSPFLPLCELSASWL